MAARPVCPADQLLTALHAHLHQSPRQRRCRVFCCCCSLRLLSLLLRYTSLRKG
jgi:hypothetical protein